MRVCASRAPLGRAIGPSMEPRRGTILAMERLSKLMAAVTSEPLGWHATLFREWVLYNALAFTILLATVYTLAGTSLDLVEQAAGRTAATLALSLGAALRRRARLAPVAGGSGNAFGSRGGAGSARASAPVCSRLRPIARVRAAPPLFSCLPPFPGDFQLTRYSERFHPTGGRFRGHPSPTIASPC